MIIFFQVYFYLKQYLETLLQPYLISYPSFSFALNVFSNPFAINQISWKEIDENLTKNILSDFLQHNVNLSMIIYLDQMNSFIYIHEPYKKTKNQTLDNSGTPEIYICLKISY